MSEPQVAGSSQNAGAIVKVEQPAAAPESLTLVDSVIFYVKDLHSVYLLDCSDRTVFQFNDLITTVTVRISEETVLTSSFQLLAIFPRSEQDPRKVALSWYCFEKRVRPFPQHEPEEPKTMLQFMVRAILQFTVNKYNRNPQAAQILYFRPMMPPTPPEMPLYPLVAQPPRSACNLPMHMHRRVIIRMDADIPHPVGRRAIQPGRRGGHNGRRICRRVRYHG